LIRIVIEVIFEEESERDHGQEIKEKGIPKIEDDVVHSSYLR